MAETLPRGPVTGTAMTSTVKRKPFFVDLYSTAVGKKYVMAITGIIGILFVIGHMVGNLKVYLGVITEVRRNTLDLARSESQPVDPDELSPPKTVGAIGMAGLTTGGEQEHGLAVLVLASWKRLSVHHRNVEFELPGWMRVHPHLDLPSRSGHHVLGRAGTYQIVHVVEVGTREHADLGEEQLKDGVRWDVGPVDQLVENIVVHPEGQNSGNGLQVENLTTGKPVECWKTVDVPPSVGTESGDDEISTHILRPFLLMMIRPDY